MECPVRKIEVPSRLWRQVLVHARATLPQEAVGFLAGSEGCVTTVIPLPNIAPSGQFLADPHAQYRAERQIQQQEINLLAIYHSHPSGGTQLSPLDVKFANERGCLHIVIALDPARPGHERRAAYEVANGGTRTAEIAISSPHCE